MPGPEPTAGNGNKGKKADGLTLPVSVVGPADLGRLIRELEAIDDALLQVGLKQGSLENRMAGTSKLMDQTIHVNRLNLLKPEDRASLKTFLETAKKGAPVLHVSFSADPPQAFLEKLVSWFRREVHPSALLTVGLQPNIGAGCILRTTNRQFDFSLRQDFADKRALLLERLAAGRPDAAPPAGSEAAAQAQGGPA